MHGRGCSGSAVGGCFRGHQRIGACVEFHPGPVKGARGNDESHSARRRGSRVCLGLRRQDGFPPIFLGVAVELDPKASGLHEAVRYADANAETLKGLFAEAGFERTVTSPMEVETRFQGFDDYWKPFLGGQGPAPTYVSSLHPSERNKLRDALHERLPIRPDGSIPMLARAWAACGHVSLG